MFEKISAAMPRKLPLSDDGPTELGPTFYALREAHGDDSASEPSRAMDAGTGPQAPGRLRLRIPALFVVQDGAVDVQN